MKQVVVVIALAAIGCGASQSTSNVEVEQPLYDCADPAQRFTCAEPATPDERFVCHATGAKGSTYVKIAVDRASSGHQPGVAHGSKPADQAPGASAADTGDVALDCECNVRVCADVCTGAADGTACDDADKCTTDGACTGGVCQPGAPRCASGTPIDACNTEDGTCDPDTGACGVAAEPAGTSCGAGSQCDDGGTCVAVTVVINEAESSGGVPGDWVELYNAGTTVAYVGGWIFKDNDDTHVYSIPAGTTLAPGAYLVLDEAQFGFGLGGAESVRLYDSLGLVDSYAWTAHAVTTYGRCPNGTGAFRTTSASTKGAANDCAPRVRLNEVESNGGIPGDWVELLNTGVIATDIGGWTFKDNDDTHVYTIPAGTTLAPGAYLVLDEAQFGFGLGGADSARVFDATGTLVDAHAWTAHAASTYGRCPNGSGPFAPTISTKGAANDCGGTTPVGAPWPGANLVTALDVLNAGNVSGLVYDGGVLWAVQNGPSTLFRIDGTNVTSLALAYPNGAGEPDAEDVTIADGAFYVATERDNAAGTISRPSILRFAPGSGVATHEWNLAADLPVLGANAGLEAITFVPDSYLTTINFYNPALYPNHGSGLFFVGVETNGMIYAYALDHVTGGFTRVTAFPSGDITSKALSFDLASGYLWQHCGAACAGQSRVLALGANLGVTTKKLYDRPTSMANLQNEGIAIAPCESGSRRFYWADDGNTDGKALRVDTIPCGAFIP